MIQDPYAVLGVSKSSTPEEIKKAYRQMAKKYHPDLHPNDPKAAEKMNEVNEAYDMIQNPAKYEKQRAQENAYREAQSRAAGYGYGSGYSSGGYSSGSGNSSGYSSSRSGSSGYSGYNSGYYGSGNSRQNSNYEYGWSSDFGSFWFGDMFGFGNASATYDTTPHAEASDPKDLAMAINQVNAGRYEMALNILSNMTSNNRNDRWYYVCACAYAGSGDYTRAEDLIQRAVRMNPENKVYKQLWQSYRNHMQSESTAYTYTGSSGTGHHFSLLSRIIIGFLAFQLISWLLSSCLYGLGGYSNNNYNNYNNRIPQNGYTTEDSSK